MNPYPAVVIGGPPHSGKSVLLYSLSQALRQRGIDHYALRACPDGEGDWANQADQGLVRQLRSKQTVWPAAWVDSICHDLKQRHLPLLVDIGGKPTADQERMLVACTHAILLTRDAVTREEWQTRMQRQHLPLLADLTSTLVGESRLIQPLPTLQGTITGLVRGAMAAGSVFDALVDQLAMLFAGNKADYRRHHLAAAPSELVIDLDRLAVTLGVAGTGGEVFWQPDHLPGVLGYLPEATPLALYGRGTNWLHGAVARLAHPAPYASFDVRLGWVAATGLVFGPAHIDAPLQFEQQQTPTYTHLQGVLPTAYIDYSDLPDLRVPPLPAKGGIILSGKLPYWLYTSLVVTYHAAPWLAVYQPRLAAAVVIYSTSNALAVGECVPLD